MKRRVLLFVMTVLTALSAQSQTTFEVPKNVILKSDPDFEKYEKDVIDAAKWLEETDINKQVEKRQEVNAFVIKWISGSPTISVEVNDSLAKIYGENNQLLALYLASYTRNYLELKSQATKQTAIKAGLISIMNVYKKGIDIKKNKEMEKVIKLNEQNKLEDYIAKHFS